MTVSEAVTAVSRVRVTVFTYPPPMATPPATTLRRAPATVTVNARGAGTEAGSRAWSKVAVSTVPFTDTLWRRGVGGGEGCRWVVRRSERLLPTE